MLSPKRALIESRKKHVKGLDELVVEIEKMKKDPYRTPQQYRQAERVLMDTLHLTCMIIQNERVSVKVMKILEAYKKVTS